MDKVFAPGPVSAFGTAPMMLLQHSLTVGLCKRAIKNKPGSPGDTSIPEPKELSELLEADWDTPNEALTPPTSRRRKPRRNTGKQPGDWRTEP